ncbi:hypothetical protein CEXT_399591 [Caerostris extrusa]|uniref:Uncharacterized protein n=1 Tax=Caerostris extrusa TaxID=172846 RepID=A0AAV4QGM8_CAEEX|nr:hypothetical protein CEXT_399591 [Caerostris extrusa]
MLRGRGCLDVFYYPRNSFPEFLNTLYNGLFTMLSRNESIDSAHFQKQFCTNITIPLNERIPLHEVCLQDKSKCAETAYLLDIRIEIHQFPHRETANKKYSSTNLTDQTLIV